MKMGEIEQRVIINMSDWFGEMNDQEDAPFGTYARVERNEPGTLTVLHESQPWGITVTVRHFDYGTDSV